MSNNSIITEWLTQLLAGAQPRTDHDQIPLAQPANPQPLLVQGGEGIVAVSLALELLDLIAAHGGTALPRHAILPWRDVLRERLEDRHRAHLEEELLRTLSWLHDTFTRGPDKPEEEPLDLAARTAMIEEARERDRDLFIGYIDPESQRVQRFRIRPLHIETHDEIPMLIAHRVPGGDELSLPLAQMRWMLLAHRFQPLETPQLADILSFPQGPND